MQQACELAFDRKLTGSQGLSHQETSTKSWDEGSGWYSLHSFKTLAVFDKISQEIPHASSVHGSGVQLNHCCAIRT
jgi:hypothetical protein